MGVTKTLQKLTTKIKENNNINTNNNKTIEQTEEDNYKIIWPWFIWQSVWHLAAFSGLILVVTLNVSFKTTLWAWIMGVAALHGALGGGHRLWSHRSYKAKLPLKLIYVFFQTMSLIYDVYDWALDHRVHHKYADTYADPYTTKRGFFNSHVGWLFITKHKDYLEKIKTMDMSDLKADPVVMFQKKYFLLFAPLIGIVLPAFVPYYFWNEDIIKSLLVASVLRQCLGMHMIFIINSVGHKFGTKPYDKNIKPTDNVIVSVFSIGEGWHNYHHTFPWDYKTGEYGNYFTNTTSALINLMAKIGWAYDLKTVSKDMIKRRSLRTGDGSKKFETLLINENNHQDHEKIEDTLWGWGDKDMKTETHDFVNILCKKKSQ